MSGFKLTMALFMEPLLNPKSATGGRRMKRIVDITSADSLLANGRNLTYLSNAWEDISKE